MRYGDRRDQVEAALVAVMKQLGAWWRPAKPPFLDGWVYHAKTGWRPVEIKDPAKKGHKDEFTLQQLIFMQECDSRGAPYFIWRECEDVLRDLNTVKVS